MGKLNVTPTGCPGPVPGSKVWRCDGENCVYGAFQYDSCKAAVTERGYTLRLSSDLIEEARESAALHEKTVQGQLERTRVELVHEAEAHRRTACTLQRQADLLQDEAARFAELYCGALIDKNAAVTKLSEDIDIQCEHCGALLQELAATRDERDYYKAMYLAQFSAASGADNLVEQETTSEEVSDSVVGSAGSRGDGERAAGDGDRTVDDDGTSVG